MFSYSCAGLVALWNIGARQGIACLSMSRLTCDDDSSSGCLPLRRSSHVLQSDGFAAVAASAGGGISAIVTVDAAGKQLLVCLLLLLLLVALLSVALEHSNHICAFGNQN